VHREVNKAVDSLATSQDPSTALTSISNLSHYQLLCPCGDLPAIS
jgi:hypothetical protein